MTNGEKFKTTKERTVAFLKFCAGKICKGPDANCILSDIVHKPATHRCEFAWLDLEYKEELKPCPFCGSESIAVELHGEYYVRCANCECQVAVVTPLFDSKNEAITAWNRRAK